MFFSFKLIVSFFLIYFNFFNKGPTCVIFKEYGECQFGLSCLFGDSHIDRLTGENLKNPTGKQKLEINQLSYETKVLLRKKKYPFEITALPDKEVKLVDFSNKVYIAPLTTVGNLPFRRILKEFGADITCSEMAMGCNVLSGQVSEWALVRKHQSETCYGIQVAGSQPDHMSRLAKLLEKETESEFVDLNCGCPIDLLCNQGCGAAMMNRPAKLLEVVSSLGKHLHRSITVKIRTGWSCEHPNAHKLLPQLQVSPFCLIMQTNCVLKINYLYFRSSLVHVKLLLS